MPNKFRVEQEQDEWVLFEDEEGSFETPPASLEVFRSEQKAECLSMAAQLSGLD